MDSTEKNVKIKRRAAEIFRFLLSGGIATLLDYATYWVMRYLVLHDGLFAGSEGWKIFSAVVATTLGFLVGAVVNWVLSVKFVFKDTTKDTDEDEDENSEDEDESKDDSDDKDGKDADKDDVEW